MTGRDFAANLASALTGAVVGAALVLAVDGATREPPPSGDRPVGVVGDAGELRPAPLRRSLPQRTTFLAWSPGGLQDDLHARIRALPQVRRATIVRAGLDWIVSSHADDGSAVDAPAAGMQIPLETAIIRPRGYAHFVPPADRAAVLSLRPGEALLARTAADIRGVGRGLRMTLRDRTVRVAGVVSDAATSGYEAIAARPVPASWTKVDEFALADAPARARARIQRVVRRSLSSGRVFRIRSETETPFLRYGDAVMPQMLIKQAFGEFAARPRPDGSIVVDAAWKRRNIASARVPVLGTVTCHRALFPQLRAALRKLSASGLSHLIDRRQFAGCYSPRFIDARPGGRLSHHSWGIALDVNVSENAPGTRPDLDERVVNAFEEWGFTWGGRWLIPDGMHFEWVRFP